jgi:hypothetical protein
MYIAFLSTCCQLLHFEYSCLAFAACHCASTYYYFSVSFVLLHLGVARSIDGLPVRRVERPWGVCVNVCIRMEISCELILVAKHFDLAVVMSLRNPRHVHYVYMRRKRHDDVSTPQRHLRGAEMPW